MNRRTVKVVGVVLIAAIGLYVVQLAIPKRDYFIDRVGSLNNVKHTETVTAKGIMDAAHLESSTGLAVDLRVIRPAVAPDQKLPLVILLGGHETGQDAVDLVGDPGSIAYAAIDYPYTADHSIDGIWQSIAAVPKIQNAFLDAPPALSLALTWALQQPWVDKDHVELVGVSLGVPFAAVAGAVDTRFARVWLLHGGGENVSWVAHVGRKHIDNDTLRRLAARAALFLVYGNSFNTEKWMQEIAPRPVVIVTACNDDYVPRLAQEPLIAASTSEHVDLVWTTGMHIGPRRATELQQLLDIVSTGIASNSLVPSVDCDVE